MTALERRTKVVLCGSNYGAFYVPSLQELNDSFELIGILAAGSERSARLAARQKIPLWASVSEIPTDADAAIVALPPTAAATVTKQLIRRGVHVLMEHPVRSDVLRDLRQEALSAKVTHFVNCHFAELSSARAFIDECRRRRDSSPPTYVSVVTAPRAAYPTFDVLGRALGSLAAAHLQHEQPPPATPKHPFASFCGVIDGVPLRVQCSQDVGPVDDGSDSPVPQRVEIGFRDGSLVLHSFAGPVLWLETLRLALRGSTNPLWRIHSPEPPTFSRLLKDRVSANSGMLREFRRKIDTGNEPVHQSTDWLSTLSELATTVRARPVTSD
ncbi:Gfo/Idh/MocA family oxidoreductase [Mycobacterium riyadhense]|uniref:Oxidoreductase family, NAD-binding Rossmann fold n=1 Tax=Mycobacterium riyadhense TaxID=486698 RepID=A0A653EV76_9MYCO|nr:Gfo/Idh/MocA family oxidoreductase [Mycobacterium riyadhense]VTP01288.1 Oxidoreductase family, NAD-binding Rossmann fold [Mycobacterium riyadhense]